MFTHVLSQQNKKKSAPIRSKIRAECGRGYSEPVRFCAFFISVSYEGAATTSRYQLDLPKTYVRYFEQPAAALVILSDFKRKRKRRKKRKKLTQKMIVEGSRRGMSAMIGIHSPALSHPSTDHLRVSLSLLPHDQSNIGPLRPGTNNVRFTLGATNYMHGAVITS